MKYTNKHNLPEAVFKALCRDTYSKGAADYSVTEILNPPQQVMLKRRYADELEEDVMDNVWSLLGKAAHHILEQHAPEDSLSEERLSIKVLDRVLSGQTDNLHDGVITDYKITSAFTLVYGSRLHEWEEQLNTYAYLFKRHGHTIKRLQIVAILRDWSEMKAKADINYPQTPIVMVHLNLWDEVKQEAFVTARIMNMICNEVLPDKELAPCLPEEMWEQPAKYAVMKKGRKTAVRVFDTTDEANNYILDNCPDNWKDGHSTDLYQVVTRPGVRTRCERYCPVASHCEQYRRYKDEQGTAGN